MLGAYFNLQSKMQTYFLKRILLCRHKNIRWGKGVKVRGGIVIRLGEGCFLDIGDYSVFNSNSKFNLVGINKKVTIGVGQGAKLIVGQRCGFSGTSLYASKEIIIGTFCNFGGNTFIWDTDFHPLNFADRRKHDKDKIETSPIYIGNDVFVGANSVILKGARIGDRAIIGAGSVVTRDIPADEIWAGNPARFIRKVNDPAT